MKLSFSRFKEIYDGMDPAIQTMVRLDEGIGLSKTLRMENAVLA
jgi:hypothetical protein